MPTTDETNSNPLSTRLLELVQETDFDFVVELIDIYLTETPKQIQAITSALEAKNYTSLMITAHTLKGGSLNLGAKVMGALCLKLEEIGRAGKSIPEGTSVADLEHEFKSVTDLLHSFKQSRK